MNEDLKLLIDHYEIEQQLLQSLLDDCLLEEDYKFAKYHLKNLRLLQKTLYNLYSLSDYNHVEKAEVLRILSNIEFMSKKPPNNFFNTFLDERLNKKLLRLNEIPVKEVEDKYDLENVIIQLLENEIRGFKLFIQKEFNLYLDFALIEADIVQIKFTPFNKLFGQYLFNNLFHDSEIESLHRNGFKLSSDQNVYYVNFDLKNQSTQFLIIFLSRIFFEILYWHSRKDFELVIY